MNSLFKKFIGFSLGPVISAGILFLIMLISTYYLEPSEYGKVSIFVAFQTLFGSFIYVGIDQSYVREFHHYKNKKLLFQNALTIPLIICFLFLIILFILKNNFSKFLFEDEKYCLISVLFAITLIFLVIERFILLFIRMREKAYEYSFFYIFLKLTILFSIILFIFFSNKNFQTIIYATIIGQIIGDFFLIFKYKKLFNFKNYYLDVNLIKGMLKFGLPIVIAISLSNFLNTAGTIFLKIFSTYENLGIYSASLRLASLMQVIQLAFTSFWIPIAYKWHKENKDIKYYSIINNLLTLVMTLGFFTLLFLKKYIVFILSKNYLESQYIMALLALPPILYTFSEVSALGISFSKKSYYNVYVSLLSIIPCLIINFLFIPNLGYIGASLAVAISYTVFYLARTYFSYKCGFRIDSRMQILVVFLFLLAALINTFDFPYADVFTFVTLVISLILQYKTSIYIFNIYKYRNKNIKKY